jgi:hypothetical protein
MDREELRVEIESRFGLTAENLFITFNDQEKTLRITYDLKDYQLLRPLNLDHFWKMLCDLPSAEAREINPESKEITVKQGELENLLQKLDPPIQA